MYVHKYVHKQTLYCRFSLWWSWRCFRGIFRYLITLTFIVPCKHVGVLSK